MNLNCIVRRGVVCIRLEVQARWQALLVLTGQGYGSSDSRLDVSHIDQPLGRWHRIVVAVLPSL
jgi:hypothetical protein